MSATNRSLSGKSAIVGLLAVVLVLLVASSSAQAADMPRVAFLSIGFGSEEPVFDAFSDELRALGQIEGKTFRFELRVAPEYNRPVRPRRLVPRQLPQTSTDQVFLS